MQPPTPPGPDNSNNPYGYEVISMDSDAAAGQQSLPLSPPLPRKRRRFQRRNSQTPAMLRFASSSPLLARLDLLEDEKDQVQQLFGNMSFFASCEGSSSTNDASLSSEMSNSWSNLALECTEEMVLQVTSSSPSSSHNKRQKPPKRKSSLCEGSF